jgi:hypothetical protein
MSGVLLSSHRAEPDKTSVTILAVTPYGGVLSPVKVTQFEEDRARGRDYSAQFFGAEGRGIPYGKYRARVVAGGRAIAGNVQVWRPDTLAVLSGPDKFIEGGPGSRGVTGEVTDASVAKPEWVRMVRVFSEDLCCTIVPLSREGKFSMGRVEEGDYLILVLSDGRVLFEGQVRIEYLNELIRVDLAKAQVTVQKQ